MYYQNNKMLNPKMEIKDLTDFTIEVRGKLLGGSTKLGFLNAHGLP